MQAASCPAAAEGVYRQPALWLQSPISARDGVHSLGCMLLQVLQEAKAIDDRAARGEDVGPLCGLGFVSKDNIDFKGFPTIAGNPALEG